MREQSSKELSDISVNDCVHWERKGVIDFSESEQF